MQTGLDAGQCTSLHVGSFSKGRRLHESWVRGNLAVERETLVFCYHMRCQGVT